jgi:endonuclease IV
MFCGDNKKRIVLDNLIKSLQAIISQIKRSDDYNNIQIMLENVPVSSSGIRRIDEFKYIVYNVPGLNVHLDIPHAFTAGGMQAIIDYIKAFRENSAYSLA